MVSLVGGGVGSVDVELAAVVTVLVVVEAFVAVFDVEQALAISTTAAAVSQRLVTVISCPLHQETQGSGADHSHGDVAASRSSPAG